MSLLRCSAVRAAEEFAINKARRFRLVAEPVEWVSGSNPHQVVRVELLNASRSDATTRLYSIGFCF